MVARASNVIERQVPHLARLVDGLIGISRLTPKQSPLERTVVDFAAVAGSVLTLFRSSGQLDGHSVSQTLDPVWIDADETRMAQVVTNLLTNAIKFTPPGGTIAVRVAADSATAMLE